MIRVYSHFQRSKNNSLLIQTLALDHCLLQLILRKISRETGEIYAYLRDCKHSELFTKLYLLDLVTQLTSNGDGGYFMTNEHGLPDLGKIIDTIDKVSVVEPPTKKSRLC